jgi:arylsulfatase A-like enzyme
MYVSGTAPHYPLSPAERHKHYLEVWDKKFDSIVASRPNYFNDTDVSAKSSWLRNTAALRKTWRENVFVRTDFKKRMASLYSVDEMIQSIHAKLKQHGELENTVWVFTSDNGYNLGAHHLIHKMAPYEESTRIPFYISGPAFPSGKVSQDLVLIQDITPTILHMAGFEIPSYMDGVSLVPEKSNSSTVEIPFRRSAILFEYKSPIASYYNVTLPMEIFPLFRANYLPGFDSDIPPYKAIRTKDHMMVDYFYFDPAVREANRHEFELYDMKTDPYQLHNIYQKVGGDKSLLVSELYTKMQKLRFCKGKECHI